jgi:hypothetical protein
METVVLVLVLVLVVVVVVVVVVVCVCVCVCVCTRVCTCVWARSVFNVPLPTDECVRLSVLVTLASARWWNSG